jgi:hypothetical protein
LRIEALIAIALTINRLTGLLIDNDGAADRIGGTGRRCTYGNCCNTYKKKPEEEVF